MDNRNDKLNLKEDNNRLLKNSSKDDRYGLNVKEKVNVEIKKEKKTLTGKKAGLQSAEEMRKEAVMLRQKEKEMFEKVIFCLT